MQLYIMQNYSTLCIRHCIIMSLLAACVSLLHLIPVLVCCANVAPGDGDPFCLDRTDRVPSPATEKTLLDTQDYGEQTLLTNSLMEDPSRKWISANFDGNEGDGIIYTVS